MAVVRRRAQVALARAVHRAQVHQVVAVLLPVAPHRVLVHRARHQVLQVVRALQVRQVAVHLAGILVYPMKIVV